MSMQRHWSTVSTIGFLALGVAGDLEAQWSATASIGARVASTYDASNPRGTRDDTRVVGGVFGVSLGYQLNDWIDLRTEANFSRRVRGASDDRAIDYFEFPALVRMSARRDFLGLTPFASAGLAYGETLACWVVASANRPDTELADVTGGHGSCAPGTGPYRSDAGWLIGGGVRVADFALEVRRSTTLRDDDSRPRLLGRTTSIVLGISRSQP